MSDYRRFLRQLALLTTLGVSIIATTNLIVDPYKVFRVYNSPFLDAKKSTLGVRVAKAEGVLHTQPEVLLLGHSRVLYGLDPAHPVWSGRDVYNGALPGCTVAESIRILEYAMDHYPALQEVVMGVEDLWITAGGAGMKPEMLNTRFNPKLNLVRYHADHLLSFGSFRRSIQTLGNVVSSPQDVTFYECGHPTAEYVAWQSEHANLQRRCRFMVKHRLARRRREKVSKQPILAMRDMIGRCQERGIRLTLFFPPTHATLMEVEWKRGRWNLIESSKRRLAGLVARSNADHPDKPQCRVWDFATYDFYSTERIESMVLGGKGASTTQNELEWFLEASHYKSVLGDLMIEQMFDDHPAPTTPQIGQLLTPQNINAWLADVREARRRYHATEVENVRWVHHMAAQYSGSAKR